MTADPVVVFIMAHGRSGSTILGNLLGELDGAFHGGEMVDLWRSRAAEDRCGCGRPLADCPVWAPLVERLEAGGEVPREDLRRWKREVLRLRNVRRLLRVPHGAPWPARERFAEALSRLYRAVAETTGARVVIDSTKTSTAAALVASVPGIRPFYVHLVRDPRAVAFSWTRRKENLRGRARKTHMSTYAPWKTARAWLLWNLAGDRVRRHAGRDGAVLVRYEDLVASPQDVLGAIRDAVAGLEGDLPMVEGGVADLGVNHTIGGNPSRFTTGRIELRADDEWISRQRPRDRRTVTAICLPLLRRYGYPVRVAPRVAVRKPA
jgi:hypothetical protein